MTPHRDTEPPQRSHLVQVHGKCILTQVCDPVTRLPSGVHVNYASPRIIITLSLAELYVNPVPGVTLSLPGPGKPGKPFWTGAVLTIRADNGTVIYRIGKYLPGIQCYEAEWPD